MSEFNTVALTGDLDLAGKRLHFIGAGGIGVSGLARLVTKHGAIVSGSDQSASEVVNELCRAGANIKIGHRPTNIPDDAQAVVISAAIKQDNPELAAARGRGLKVYKYAQMLGLLMNHYEGIAVSGTHGKSTTSGWLTYLLKQAGVDANFIIGASINQLGSSSGVADSRFFVAEACEFDRSFLNLKPRIACILNIEQDHLDYYRDEQEIVEAFGDFALGTKPGGVLIANGQDHNAATVLERVGGQVRYETFGLDRSCDYYADNLDPGNGLYSFDVYGKCQHVGRTQISVPGRHNVFNALAVTAMAINAGISADVVLGLLDGFTGMDRRLMLKGRLKDVTILDDYAHHPTEIRASLLAIRERYTPRRLFCVFQPHQYSRTRFLLDDFAESFKLADVTIVPQIYFVRDSEQTCKQVNAQVLVDRMRANGTDALFIEQFGAIGDYLRANLKPGDAVVTMGAGDIWKVADEYIQWLGRNC
jgi:UDP-N-acetylmuramate--alanine ligase